MANLDVSDVLDDPDFLDTTLQVRRGAVTMTQDGLGQSTAGWLPFAAVVIPDGGQDLIQTGEGNAVTGDITVYTRTELTAGDERREADLIIWDGDTYRILNAQAWRYGSGYFRAVGQITTLNATQAPPDDAGFLG